MILNIYLVELSSSEKDIWYLVLRFDHLPGASSTVS